MSWESERGYYCRLDNYDLGMMMCFSRSFPSLACFFRPALIWVTLAATVWFMLGDALGSVLGFQLAEPDADPVIGIGFL
jgi:ABC-type long-subunit fatty acid transport system fused permease/ATPase subunit